MLKDKIKIAVFVSGGGTNLQAILESEKRGEIVNGEISLVISHNKNAYALERAKNFGVKSVLIDKEVFKTIEEREQKMIEVLKENSIDLIVLAGYLSILSENFTKLYANKIINVHPSLIPSFCGKGYYGLKVHEEALKYGVKVTGATVHFVNEIPDGGKIIMQKAVEIKDGDTPEILQRRVMEQAEWIILPRAVEEVSKKLRG